MLPEPSGASSTAEAVAEGLVGIQCVVTCSLMCFLTSGAIV